MKRVLAVFAVALVAGSAVAVNTFIVTRGGRVSARNMTPSSVPEAITRAPTDAEVDALLTAAVVNQPFTVDHPVLNAACDASERWRCCQAVDFACSNLKNSALRRCEFEPPDNDEGTNGYCGGQCVNRLLVWTQCPAS